MLVVKVFPEQLLPMSYMTTQSVRIVVVGGEQKEKLLITLEGISGGINGAVGFDNPFECECDKRDDDGNPMQVVIIHARSSGKPALLISSPDGRFLDRVLDTVPPSSTVFRATVFEATEREGNTLIDPPEARGVTPVTVEEEPTEEMRFDETTDAFLRRQGDTPSSSTPDALRQTSQVQGRAPSATQASDDAPKPDPRGKRLQEDLGVALGDHDSARANMPTHESVQGGLLGVKVILFSLITLILMLTVMIAVPLWLTIRVVHKTGFGEALESFLSAQDEHHQTSSVKGQATPKTPDPDTGVELDSASEPEIKPLVCTKYTSLHITKGPEPDGCFIVGCQEGYAAPMVWKNKKWNPCEHRLRVSSRSQWCYNVIDHDGQKHTAEFVNNEWMLRHCE
jgi:hypothetical protein